MESVEINIGNKKDQRTVIQARSTGVKITKWDIKSDKEITLGLFKSLSGEMVSFHIFKGSEYIGNGSAEIINLRIKKLIVMINEETGIFDHIEIYI